MDFRKRQQRPYTPLMISGTPVERVCSFKYLGVNISEDLTWTTQTQVKKARQRLYHLRQLRKFRVSPAILKTFYSGAIESVLTQCISVWYNNATNQDCKALQHWSQTQFLEGHSSAQFSSNPNQTHLIQLLMITRNFQAGVIWSWLKLNCAELRPSRNWVWDQCQRVIPVNHTGQHLCTELFTLVLELLLLVVYFRN